MNFKEFLRFTYGLVMGTSTPYLKSSKRFLFPTYRHEISSDFGLFLGGSGICGILVGNSDALVVNTNQGVAALEFRDWVKERANGKSLTIVLNSSAADFAAGLGSFVDARQIFVGPSAQKVTKANVVRNEVKIEAAGAEILLIPVEPHVNGTDLVVFVPSKKTLFLGSLFYNHVHPILHMRDRRELAPTSWIDALEGLLRRFSDAEIFVPAEGDVATVEDVREFVSYLKDLANPQVDFAECRRKYDWPEIPGTTSLEENFELLRQRLKSHTTLN